MDLSNNDLPPYVILQILDFFDWGCYYENGTQNHDFLVNHDLKSSITEYVGEWGGEIDWTPKKYVRELFGKFKKDQSGKIYLVMRYGLQYTFIDTPGTICKLSNIIPLCVKGLKIVVEAREVDLSRIDFSNICPLVSTLFVDGIRSSQVLRILSEVRMLRSLTVNRLSDRFVFKEKNSELFHGASLKKLYFRTESKFKRPGAVKKFFGDLKAHSVALADFPSLPDNFKNEAIKSLMLKQNIEVVDINRNTGGGMGAILIQHLMQHLSQSPEFDGVDINDVLSGIKLQTKHPQIIENIQRYRTNFPNLRMVKFEETDVREVAKFLEGNEICEKLYVTYPKMYPETLKRGGIKPFKNSKVTQFAAKFWSDPDPSYLSYLLSGLSSLRVLSIVSQFKKDAIKDMILGKACALGRPIPLPW